MAQKTPARSTLAAAIKKIWAETLEAVNRLLLLEAEKRGVEDAESREWTARSSKR